MFVLTLDQRASRRGEDLVETLLERMDTAARGRMLRAFERTAGDEAQGVLADPAAVCEVLLALLRADAWHVGVGIGPVDEPLPASTRAGRGPAFLRARRAVNRAKSAPHRLSVVGADDYRAAHVETVLWLLATTVSRRSRRGWEVADLLAQRMTRARIAETLGVSESAVSQRIQVAGLVEEERGRELLVTLLVEADR